MIMFLCFFIVKSSIDILKYIFIETFCNKGRKNDFIQNGTKKYEDKG